MYATVAAAAALHQVLLRSLGEDKVVAQERGLGPVLRPVRGPRRRTDQPLLATSMLGYLISDSTSVTTRVTRFRGAVTAMLLLVSLDGGTARTTT